jgi:hypothetical protein
MSVPQVKDRPASALRAVFAGIGSLLSGNKSGKDKLRATPAAEAPANAQAPAPQAETPETTAKPETAAAPEAVAAEPEAVAAAPATEAAAEAEPAAEPETVVAEAVAGLPLENYEELTVASLRARLRNLSNDDLTVLKEYEAAHQNRPEVIKMFQNRLIKMTSSMPKLEE